MAPWTPAKMHKVDVRKRKDQGLGKSDGVWQAAEMQRRAGQAPNTPDHTLDSRPFSLSFFHLPQDTHLRYVQ